MQVYLEIFSLEMKNNIKVINLEARVHWEKLSSHGWFSRVTHCLLPLSRLLNSTFIVLAQ